jgi:S-adenosylmethionine:tRNA ribosyltransferase-isomerase
MNIKDININDYDYDLPKGRIAQYPLSERDSSKLLVRQDGTIKQDIFRNIDEYIPSGSLLVFNNSRVIKARLLFGKETGAQIEVLCLEPLNPSEYENSFSSVAPVEWKCIVGNLKKWKKGKISISFIRNGQQYNLDAERQRAEGEAWRIRFIWNNPCLSFGEVVEAVGHVPLPPYIARNDEMQDMETYQTVYSKVKGSVAAPTAGLHFTNEVFKKLSKKHVNTAEITLHVGAGTFQPVKSEYISGHEMHCEHFFISAETIEEIIRNEGRLIAIGTTSVRTIESLYWLGIKIMNSNLSFEGELFVSQWESYENEINVKPSLAMNSILEYMKANNLLFLHVTTSIIIIPGYKFRLVNGLITNFHQPRSTLLLLISAFTGEKWKDVYDFALKNDFRFLSYGDGSLILR